MGGSALPYLSFISLLLSCAHPAAAAAATSVTLCGPAQVYTPHGSQFTFSSNAWADDGSGSQCIYISDDATIFNATWAWAANLNNVHAYPNINLDSTLLPIPLSQVTSLTLQTSWSMAPEGSDVSPIDTSGLNALDTRANVALDLFADKNAVTAGNASAAGWEIMVWLAMFGSAAPLGYNAGGQSVVYDLDGNGFTLYNGTNQNGQKTYTWLANDDLTVFSADVMPLVTYLIKAGYVDAAAYLGVCQFGTEAFHATSNVTFSTWDFSMEINNEGPNATVTSSGSTGGTATGYTGVATTTASGQRKSGAGRLGGRAISGEWVPGPHLLTAICVAVLVSYTFAR